MFKSKRQKLKSPLSQNNALFCPLQCVVVPYVWNGKTYRTFAEKYSYFNVFYNVNELYVWGF